MRPRLTEIDYAIIAVAPALIMVLVGSLVLFVTELFYEGPHGLRLNFILCMFVLGIVSIARISIEQGTVRAVPFGVLLGGLVAFAVGRFVPEALVLTCVLLAIVWWVSTRLVYDCTVVAQSVDSSKKGLMQWIRRGDSEDVADEPTSDEPDRPQGVTIRDESTDQPTVRSKLSRWLNPTDTQFAPGAWVVYFSLAALPIFGLGQAFAGNLAPASRWYLFNLLVAYVAAALCLLVTTSFLGLRRYLQTRGVQMPLSMTGTWLGVGFGMVALVLLAVSILPRPNAEYELAQLPFYEDRQERTASQFATGQDGTDDPRSDRQRTTSDSEQTTDESPASSEARPDGRQPRGDEGPQGERTTPGESSESGNHAAENSQQDASDVKNPSDSQNRQGQTPDSQEAAESGSATQPERQQPDGGHPEPSKPPESSNPSESPNNDQQPGEQTRPEQDSQDAASNEADSEGAEAVDSGQAASENVAPPASPPLSELFSSLGDLLKLCLYMGLFALALFLIWYFRDELARSWAEFWSGLFGQRQRPPSEKGVEKSQATRRRPTFATFANPFQDPRWKGRPLEEWVRYSFSAVEAWADEQGHGRKEEQTPGEFAAMLERQFAGLNNAVRQTAELYGQVAYGSGKAPGETPEILRNLWQRLPTAQPTPRSSRESDHAPGTH